MNQQKETNSHSECVDGMIHVRANLHEAKNYVATRTGSKSGSFISISSSCSSIGISSSSFLRNNWEGEMANTAY